MKGREGIICYFFYRFLKKCRGVQLSTGNNDSKNADLYKAEMFLFITFALLIDWKINDLNMLVWSFKVTIHLCN